MSLFIAGDEPTRRMLFRFYRDLEDAAPATILLFLADVLGARGQTLTPETLDAALTYVEAFLQPLIEARQQPLIPAPLLDGHDIIQIFRLPSGPHIGQLLDSLMEAQAAGEVETREQAIGYIDMLLEQGDNG
jgi:hypothetical protein